MPGARIVVDRRMDTDPLERVNHLSGAAARLHPRARPAGRTPLARALVAVAVSGSRQRPSLTVAR